MGRFSDCKRLTPAERYGLGYGYYETFRKKSSNYLFVGFILHLVDGFYLESGTAVVIYINLAISVVFTYSTFQSLREARGYAEAIESGELE